jgi:hypothetical protein
MGRTWEALRRAERERDSEDSEGLAGSEGGEGVIDEAPLSLWLEEELASVQVSLHAVEDRLELELGALRDELREGLAKAREHNPAAESASADRLRREISALHAAAQRVERRTRWTLFAVIAIGLAALLWP